MQDDAELSSLAALSDLTRRRLYAYVAGRRGAVGRDEAARAAGISRMLAAFHLEKLVAAGLLVTEYRRLSGRSGPGAGRPSKLYRRSARQLTVMLPARRYEDAARLLATAAEAGGRRATQALRRAARAFGRELGEAAREQAGPRVGRARLAGAAEQALREYGFEPARANGDLLLHSCPFAALTQQHRQTVCRMNLQLLSGFVRSLNLTGLKALLVPAPDRCCVVLRGLPAHRPGRAQL